MKKTLSSLALSILLASSIGYAAHENIIKSGLYSDEAVSVVNSSVGNVPVYSPDYRFVDRYQYQKVCEILKGPIYEKQSNTISVLQGALRYNELPSLGQTGYYGNLTQYAVKLFQRKNGIYPTGYVGPQTYKTIRSVWCSGYEPVTQPVPAPAPQPLSTPTGVRAPGVSVSISPQTFANGQTVQLNWASTNANSCTVNGVTVQTSGSQNIVISPSLVSYTIQCSGLGGFSSQTISTNYTNIGNPVVNNPIVNVSVNNNSIINGQSATINLQTTNVASCNVTGGVYNNNSVTINGQITVTPTQNTTYTFNCLGTNGQQSNGVVTVNVASVPVTNIPGYLNISNANLKIGSTTNISWQVPSNITNAQGVIIDLINSSGNVVGTVTRLPENTTTYGNISNMGNINWTVPQGIRDQRNDAISCQTINGQQVCGNTITAGQYKLRATYFTPGNACFGFCQNVAGQQTLGTVESPVFNIAAQATVVNYGHILGN